ncbi:MAG: alpha/beta hydrolase [Pseudomonadota bacterium]
MKKSVVMIHGAFAGPWCWDEYKTFFEKQGWNCHTPALRYHDGDPKAEPDPDFANTSIADYADDIADLVQSLDAKPVLLGHAIGGMIAQQVAARGLASAVVAINPNAPWGMLPETDDERAVARSFMEMGAFWNGPLRVPFELMAPFALNKLDDAAQHDLFDKLGAESGRVMFEMFFWMFDDNRAAEVQFDKVKCPVLVVSGEEDRAVRHQLGKQIAEKYGSRGTHHLAKGHAHFLFLEPGWETPANFSEHWMSKAVAR